MRTKSRGGKAKVSRIPPKPSTVEVRFLNHLAKPCCSEDESATPHRDNDDDLPTSSSGKLGVVLGQKRLNSISGPEVSLERVWKRKVTCIMCNKGGGALVCSVSGCPLAIHDKCMTCSPSFDDMGNFYCPYCSYKRAAEGCDQAMAKVMLAKEALSNFIDNANMIDGDDQQKQEAERAKTKELNSSTVVRDCDEVPNQSVQAEEDEREAASAPDCTSSILPTKGAEASLGNQQNDVLLGIHGSDNRRQEETLPVNVSFQASITEGKVDNAKNSGTHQFLVENVGEIEQVEDSVQPDDNRHEEVHVEDQKQPEENVDPSRKSSSELVNTTAGKNAGDGSRKVLTSVQPDDNRHEEVRVEDQKQPEENVDPSRKSSSELVNTTAGKNAGDGSRKVLTSVQPDDNRHKEVCVEDQKQPEENVDPSRKSTSELVNTTVGKNAGDRSRKVLTSSKSRELQMPSKRLTSPTFSNVRRKKLPWTTEEEEMLKEGVQKFSTTVKKNLPWRKILEFGHHIFDGTRTPVDLKDKWRNILGKESSAINKSL